MLTVPTECNHTLSPAPPVWELMSFSLASLGVTAGSRPQVMPLRQLERRLSAVLVADVVGYTRLMEADEEDTHTRLMQLWLELLQPKVAQCQGRIVKHTGDGFIATFDGIIEATQCAIELQQEVTALERRERPDRRIAFRLGLNLCDTIFEAFDVFGDGVNVAARLQAYAEPGDIVITENVAKLISSLFGTIPRLDLGHLHLKNISAPTRAFSLRIGSAVAGTRRIAQNPPTPWPSLAVLPFRMLETRPEESYFAEGIVEDIIQGLSGLKELLVISRNSTLRYGGLPVDVRTIGQELGVRYVLSGTVRRSGGRLRIATELSETESGSLVQADRYEGDVAKLFALQDEISTRVVATIAPHVREWELRRALRKHPESMDAYDLVLQGLDLVYRLDYESYSRARGFFQRAIQEDSGYARAYAYASLWHIFRVGQGWSLDPDADAFEAARLAAEAIERDKYDALGLAFHGHALSWFLKEYDAAVTFLDRAISAGPSCAMAWTLSSLTCAYLGDGATAVARSEHALRLSPLDTHAFYLHSAIGLAHYVAGDYEVAVECGRRSAAHNNSFCANKRFMIISLVALGRMAEARSIAQALLRLQPDFRIIPYIPRCPLRDPAQIEIFIERLRAAGLPD
jgi:adenylate cyclase